MGPLATQFLMQLSFGVLFALAFVPRAPVGALFYRTMGTVALVPALAALWGLVGGAGASWGDPLVLAALAVVVSYPLYSGPLRGIPWALSLAVGTLGAALAVVLAIGQGVSEAGWMILALGGGSALATGAVAGSVGLAMVLGHWYLTVPNLSISHLERLNRLTMACMVLALLFLAATCWGFADRLRELDADPFGPMGLFFLGTRVTVGLLLPLAFAAMAMASLRHGNTRSATGILYASTVLVLIGTAVSVAIQDTYGIPL